MSKNRMWNFDKVQKDYLNKILKNDCEWFAAADDCTAYISNGHFIVAMPREFCGIDCNLPDHTRITAENFKKMIDVNIYDFEELSDSKTTMQHERDNIRMLKNSEGVDIWINEKYVKYFEDMNIKYYGSGPKNVVYVEAHGCIVGLILPINHK